MKHLIIIFILFTPFTILSQRSSTVFFRDIKINSEIILEFFDSVNDKVMKELNSRDRVSVNQPYISWYYNNEEFLERIKIPHIKSSSYRVFMSTNDSLNELQIIACSQNVIYNQTIPYRKGTKVTSEPLFVLPLVDLKQIINESDYKQLCTIISNNLITNLVDENIYNVNQERISADHIFFKDFPLIEELFDPMDIINSGIDSYRYPNSNDSNLVENPYNYVVSSIEYSDSLGVFWKNQYTRELIGLSASIVFEERMEETEAARSFKSAFSITIDNSFLGFTFVDEDHLRLPKENFFNYDLYKHKILWFRADTIKSVISDPIFDSGVQYILAKKLLSKVKINELYTIEKMY